MMTSAKPQAHALRWSGAELALGLSVLVVAYLLLARPSVRPTELSGPTMGTVYRITLATTLDQAARGTLSTLVDERLSRINALMSTYDPASSLSRFNASSSTDWVDIPEEVVTVVEAARDVSQRSHGRFDVTAGPLVNLWGFGPEAAPAATPSDAAIASARERVGYRMLESRTNPSALRKGRSDLYVDLSAIAKGYAVDQLAKLLLKRGHTDFLIEIGGELRASGTSVDGDPWRVGIEQPNPDGRTVEQVLPLEDRAMATSGDYRNVMRFGGQTLAHGIDVKSGRPMPYSALSVTVFHPSCMVADAWATALLVTPLEEARSLAEAEGLEVLLVYQDGDRYAHWKSAELKARET